MTENDIKALNQPLANIMTDPGIGVVLTSEMDYFVIRAQGQSQELFLNKTPDFEVLARARLGCGPLLRIRPHRAQSLGVPPGHRPRAATMELTGWHLSHGGARGQLGYTVSSTWG